MTAPVQVLVIGLEEPALPGTILAELARLGDAGIARLLDVLLVSRAEDGRLETLPAPPGADPQLGRLATALLAEAEATSGRAGPVAADPTHWSLEDAIPRGGTAAIALIEHTWAQPLVLAIRGAGGRLLEEAWLAPDDRELLDSLAGRAP